MTICASKMTTAMGCLLLFSNAVPARALLAICIAISSCTGVFAQQTSRSALQVAERSSFFADVKERESAASLISSFERAVKAGADIYEADKDGNSAFLYAIAFTVTNSEGESGNPVVKALIRLGVDVNRPIGAPNERIFPICFPLILGPFNNELLELLIDAGASKKVLCDGPSVEDTAKRQSTNPYLLKILKKYP